MWTKIIMPENSEWYICIVDGKRMPLRYNTHNKFWVGLAGKTYKPDEITWLDDCKIENEIIKITTTK